MEIPAELERYVTQEYLIAFGIGLAKVIAIFVLTLILLKVVKFSIERWQNRLSAKRDGASQETDHEKEKRLKTITSLINKGLNILVISLGILVALQTVGVSIGPILASAGVLGLAIGFGAQNLVKDIISGFFILFEDQVREGDVAVINGQGGLVERINFRTIVLRALDGSVHYFPNGSITTVSNMTKGWSAMVFDIGVAYKEDLNKVMEVMKESFQQLRSNAEFGHKILDEEMEIFGLDQFGDSALVVKARIKTTPLDQWSIGREYRKILKENFDREKIEIPFPHRSIYFGEASAPFEVASQNSKESSATGADADPSRP